MERQWLKYRRLSALASSGMLPEKYVNTTDNTLIKAYSLLVHKYWLFSCGDVHVHCRCRHVHLVTSEYITTGVCKQWTGLLDWITRLDYWTDLLPRKKGRNRKEKKHSMCV